LTRPIPLSAGRDMFLPFKFAYSPATKKVDEAKKVAPFCATLRGLFTIVSCGRVLRGGQDVIYLGGESEQGKEQTLWPKAFHLLRRIL